MQVLGVQHRVRTLLNTPGFWFLWHRYWTAAAAACGVSSIVAGRQRDQRFPSLGFRSQRIFFPQIISDLICCAHSVALHPASPLHKSRGVDCQHAADEQEGVLLCLQPNHLHVCDDVANGRKVESSVWQGYVLAASQQSLQYGLLQTTPWNAHNKFAMRCSG
jgi:hypothetical protein